MTTAEPRWATARSPERKTLGGAAAKVAKLLGLPLMVWQRRVLDVSLEVDATGRLVFRDVVLSTPRQSGKTVCLLSLILTRALVEPGSHIVYAAQSALDAKKKAEAEWWPAIENSLLAGQVTVRRAPGREGMQFANGSRQSIAASTQKAAHGEVIDLAIVDEAFSYADARLEQSLKPGMMTRPNNQFWVVSTAGTPERSAYLWEKVQNGRAAVEAGLTDSVAYFEYSAPDGADPADVETWRACMPALNTTVAEDTVRAAQQTMARSEFSRAYLNRWVSSMSDPIVSIEWWESLAEPDAPRPEWIVLGLDIAPKGASAAIVAVGEHGTELHAAVLEHGDGTDWVPGALESLSAEYSSPRVILDPKACGAMLPEIERATNFNLTELDGGDVQQACEFWLKLVREGRLRHRGEPELTIALDGAGQRRLGDGWAWSRRGSGTDIAPLCALCWATWFWRGSWGTL